MIGAATQQNAALTTTSAVAVPPDPATIAAAELRFQGLTPATAVATTNAASNVDPLDGFSVRASAGDRRKLAAALERIGSSAIGSELLDAVRNRGISMQALDDAAFDRATRGQATDAVAVFVSGGTAGAQLLVRADALTATGGDVDAPEHVIAHELTHAAQYVAGEDAAVYQAASGAAGARLGADQLRAGKTLMAESGAELLATAMMAQLQAPERFNAVAASRIEESAAQNWERVASVAAYNPGQLDLPRVVSPVATKLLRDGLPGAT